MRSWGIKRAVSQAAGKTPETKMTVMRMMMAVIDVMIMLPTMVIMFVIGDEDDYDD